MTRLHLDVLPALPEGYFWRIDEWDSFSTVQNLPSIIEAAEEKTANNIAIATLAIVKEPLLVQETPPKWWQWWAKPEQPSWSELEGLVEAEALIHRLSPIPDTDQHNLDFSVTPESIGETALILLEHFKYLREVDAVRTLAEKYFGEYS